MLESETIQEIIEYLVDELGGDWFLTGGALVRLSFDPNRGTEDVDLVRISHPEHSDEHAKHLLFRWLIRRGLGPEWVNSAVEPFVKEVPGWQQETVLLRSGSRGRVFRPNLTLFTYLKLRRGTEIDLADLRRVSSCCPEKFEQAKFDLWADESLRKKLRVLKSNLGL